MNNDKVFQMDFGKVYGLLLDKAARKGRSLIQFAASRRHFDLYSSPEAVAAFAAQLTEYKTSKGTIQLPYSKPLPLELIREIAKWCEENN